MPLDTLAADLWPLLLLSAMMGIAAFPLALVCSFLYSALSQRFEHVPKPVWFFFMTFVGTFLAVLAIYIYLDVTFADLVQSVPSSP